MSPDEIRVYLKQAHPELIAEPRINPDGWSFFDGPPQRGANSNRIIRAVRNGPHGVTRLKAAQIESPLVADCCQSRRAACDPLQTFITFVLTGAARSHRESNDLNRLLAVYFENIDTVLI